MLVASLSFAQYASKTDAVNMKASKPATQQNVEFSTRSTQAIIFQEGFEFTSGDLENGWTSVDQDGDANDWFTYNVAGAPHSGAYCMGSASWSSTALTPNNWLISPAIDLTSETGTIMAGLWVAAQDPSWTDEHYKIVLSTTGTATTDFTNLLLEETVPGTGWYERNMNISAFAGQTVYIAIVHFNCTDMFYFKVDDFSVYTNDVTDAAITAITSPNYLGGCALADEDVTITIANNGGADITGFEVSYTVNGGTPVVETVSATIAPAATLNYTFTQTADLSVLGTYDFEVNVNLTGDAVATNNMMTKSVISGDKAIVIHGLTDNMGGQSWQVINNLTSEVVAERTTGWQWNVEITNTVCVIDANCYTVIVSDLDGDGMVDGTAYLEILYDGTQVAGSTTPDSWSTATLTAENLGSGCAGVDAQILSIDPIYSACELGSVDVVVVIKNGGTSDITTFDVNYSINGGTAVVETVTQTIAAGATYIHTFATQADLSADGTYEITATVILAGDEIAANNSLMIETTNLAPTSIPYTSAFETNEDLAGWAIEDSNNDTYSWGISTSGVGATNALTYGYNSAANADDWAFSTCLDLVGGTSYTVKFDYAVASATFAEKMNVSYGDDQSSTSMTLIQDLGELTNIDFATGSYNFIPATSGTYYVGLHCYSDMDMYNLYIDNFSVEITVNVNTNVASAISVYPNPANSVITVANAENSNITVINMVGAVVSSVENASANQTIDISNLANGTYFVRVNGDVFKINVVK